MTQRLWALQKKTALGCGNILDRLAGTLTAVSAAILMLPSNMCRKFTASFHLVTKGALCTWLSPSSASPGSSDS